MLARRSDPGADDRVRITVDGQAIEARRGDSVAAAVLAAGVMPTRHAPVSGAPRTPYCMMGVCFECLMTIDGRTNRQACMTPVQDGMVVEPQLSRPGIADRISGGNGA